MSFYYPLGLLGLIGIPVIIVIYIIKSKYTEQVVPSTYLWELSERFLKKRKPISKLTGIISLLLQIFAVLFVSFAIAHPVFTVPDSANDIYLILDGSASMNMRQDGQTRFESAKAKINGIIDEAHDGSTYSLILAGDTTDVVFEGVSDKKQAKLFVEGLTAGWTASDCGSALSLAQGYFDANRSALLYLFTDKQYEVNEALTLVDVSLGEQNFAFYRYGYDRDANGVRGLGQVISYQADATLRVELWVADNAGEEPRKVAETEVEAVKEEPTDFVLSSELREFAQLELRIADADAFAEDNRVVLYDAVKGQTRKVLLVSEISDKSDAIYLKGAIATAGKAQVDTVTPEKYEEQPARGYGMYVFNGYTPAEIPTNAAIWLIDSIDGGGGRTGVSFRNYAIPRDTEGEDSYYTTSFTEGSSSLDKLFTKDLVRREIAVRRYAQYSVPRSFTPVMSIDNDSVVFAGLNKNNDRQVVFAFRIQDSNFGMTDDFLILVRNLMDYSFPAVLSQTTYVCGDTMAVNVVPGCEGIVLTSPSGKRNTLDTMGTDVCEVKLAEAGTYKLTVKLQGSEENDLFAYSCVPEEESRGAAGAAMLLAGEREHNYSDGYYESLLAFFIVIALLLLADWGVYCYEQHQLR